MKSLTDVVSGAGLSGYAEIALVLFLLAFVGIVISLFVPSRQRTYERMRHLPIEPDSADTAAPAALAEPAKPAKPAEPASRVEDTSHA